MELAKKQGHKRYLPREKFKACRLDLGLTQRELAEIFFVTETTIRNVEAGRGVPAQEFMVKAADFFKADVFELFPEAPLLKHLRKNKFTKT
ncbi:helix-turn-helix transcriptional regulator [Paenibacillus ehimensis]|uniref:helix-turn-helix transcriptional regulator n=1 Tax=Paenibacillus ehimensis TaxID=79264 RepID=UPI002C6F8A7F|nr:helix-turn-helix transcriptional regulator [Bacillus sp. (in: firmicutes)]